jgi:hypothetical protein
VQAGPRHFFLRSFSLVATMPLRGHGPHNQGDKLSADALVRNGGIAYPVVLFAPTGLESTQEDFGVEKTGIT